MRAGKGRGSARKPPGCASPVRPTRRRWRPPSPTGFHLRRPPNRYRIGRSMAKAALVPTLEFERPIVDLERKIQELRKRAQGAHGMQPEIQTLEARVAELQQEIFADLTPWQTVLLSRHPGR